MRRPYGKSWNPPSRRRTERSHKSRRSWPPLRDHEPQPIRSQVHKGGKASKIFRGWVATLDTINLHLASPFRNLSQVPLPKDPSVEEVPQGGLAKAEEDSPNFCELLEEIEVHTTNTNVIDVDNLSPLGIVQPLVALVRSEVAEDSPDPTPPVTKQSPNT
nr:hypothetical protein CFP56_78232 [Quercus suber]POE73626.1 hypothetical protein CFP56_26985 [Quercus suber]